MQDKMRARIMAVAEAAPQRRLRPRDLRKEVEKAIPDSPSFFGEVLRSLVAEGALFYSYRDPCSYLEIPCHDADGNISLCT